MISERCENFLAVCGSMPKSRKLIAVALDAVAERPEVFRKPAVKRGLIVALVADEVREFRRLPFLLHRIERHIERGGMAMQLRLR
jgi:hypothetical protein